MSIKKRIHISYFANFIPLWHTVCSINMSKQTIRKGGPDIMKKVIIPLSIFCLIMFVSQAMAQPKGKRGWDEQGWGMHPSMLEDLNLTPEQTEKMKALRNSYYKDTIPIRGQLYTNRAELRLLWMQDEPNAQEIKAKQREVHALQGQLNEKNIDFRLSFRNLLTEEQRKKITNRYLERKQSKRRGKEGDRARKGTRGRKQADW
jgi:Spy/CpxP family protein refolding chaperone